MYEATLAETALSQKRLCRGQEDVDVNVDVGFQRRSTNWGHRKLRSTNQRKSNQMVFDESLRKTGEPGEKPFGAE